MLLARGSFAGRQAVADPHEFVGEFGVLQWERGDGLVDDAVVVAGSVLADVLVAEAEITVNSCEKRGTGR